MKLDTTIPELEETIGKPITPLQRNGLEEQADQLLKEAKTKHVAILVGGDALSATTHISLLLDAHDDKIETQVIHGSSIFTAITDTGLSLYKYGKTVTIALPEKGPVDTAIRTIKENSEHGLHTLLLLDLNMRGKQIPHHPTSNQTTNRHRRIQPRNPASRSSPIGQQVPDHKSRHCSQPDKIRLRRTPSRTNSSRKTPLHRRRTLWKPLPGAPEKSSRTITQLARPTDSSQNTARGCRKRPRRH